MPRGPSSLSTSLPSLVDKLESDDISVIGSDARESRTVSTKITNKRTLNKFKIFTLELYHGLFFKNQHINPRLKISEMLIDRFMTHN